jgi:hypothetical protein
MKYTLIIFTLILLSGLTFGQKSEKTDFLPEIIKRDISGLLTLDKFNIENDTAVIERMEPLGFIGANFQRLQIHFITVIKNPFNPAVYFVYGKTKVKRNICSFHGNITLTESNIYTDTIYAIDTIYPNIEQGFFKGKYEFKEDLPKRGAGIFSGKFNTYFYLDQYKNLKYNALEFGADGYSNNEFEGIWKSNKNGDIKKCNWGDYRIPDSENLDIGAGEFSVDEKYLKYGWRNLMKTYGYQNNNKKSIKQARKREDEKWWK